MIGQAMNDNEREGPPDWLIDLVMSVAARCVRDFADAIQHGLPEHRRWLTEAVEAYIAGDALPAPRG